jgi:transcription antitermination factor NusB
MGEPASTRDVRRGSTDRRRTRRTDTQDPRRARERALKILFQADVRGVAPDLTLRGLVDDPAARAMLDEVEDLTMENVLPPEPAAGAVRGGEATRRAAAAAPSGGGARRPAGIDGFTRALVLGVADHQPRIDALIGRFARRWQIHRMPVLDRNVLRLGTYELLFEETSPAVVINEAVNLAKALSTDDSGRYVNGVLEAIRRHLAEEPAEPATAADSGAADEAGTDQDGTVKDGTVEDGTVEDGTGAEGTVEDGTGAEGTVEDGGTA